MDIFATPTMDVPRSQWIIDLLADNNPLGDVSSVDGLVALMDKYPVAPIAEKIAKLEEWLLTQPQVEMPVKHYVCNGMYYRELFIQKGAILTGHTHLEDHISIVISGDITVLSKDGLKRLKAGDSFPADSMVKRAGFAHEDTIFVNIHRTNEQDPDKAAAACIKKKGE